MNRFGHCVEDKLVRRTNISLESTAVKTEQVLQSHIKKEKHLVSDLVWDSFDIDIELLSGANTIHYTYDTHYQNISPGSSKSTMHSSLNYLGNVNFQASTKS